jgi:hypothetical protein
VLFVSRYLSNKGIEYLGFGGFSRPPKILFGMSRPPILLQGISRLVDSELLFELKFPPKDGTSLVKLDLSRVDRLSVLG